MTTAPSARQVLASLDRSRQAAQMQALADLNGAEEAEVRRALTAVKGGAKIDVPVLLSTIRRGIAERAEAEAARAGGDRAFRYGLQFMSTPELERLRDQLRARAEAGEGGEPYSSAATTPPAPAQVICDDDLDLDDEEPDDPPRVRSIPRIPSRRAAASSRSPARPANPAPTQEQRVLTRPSGSAAGFLGPRLLGPGDPGRPFGMSVDYDPHFEHFPPPWLISDGDDDDTKEKADVAIESRVADAF